jgi:hypothetical protein
MAAVENSVMGRFAPIAVERGEDWFQWEERPGPEPASNATGPNDDFVIRVCNVERNGPLGG